MSSDTSAVAVTQLLELRARLRFIALQLPLASYNQALSITGQMADACHLNGAATKSIFREWGFYLLSRGDENSLLVGMEALQMTWLEAEEDFVDETADRLLQLLVMSPTTMPFRLFVDAFLYTMSVRSSSFLSALLGCPQLFTPMLHMVYYVPVVSRSHSLPLVMHLCMHGTGNQLRVLLVDYKIVDLVQKKLEASDLEEFAATTILLLITLRQSVIKLSKELFKILEEDVKNTDIQQRLLAVQIPPGTYAKMRDHLCLRFGLPDEQAPTQV